MTAKPNVLPGHAVEDTRLGDAAFRILAAICRHAGNDGWCFPSVSRLADITGRSRQAVQRQIEYLVKLGYLEVVPQRRENGSQTANRYRVLFDGSAPIAGGVQHDVAGGVQHDVAGGCNMTLQGVQHDVAPITIPIEEKKQNAGVRPRVKLVLESEEVRTWVSRNRPDIDADALAKEAERWDYRLLAKDQHFQNYTAAFIGWLDDPRNVRAKPSPVRSAPKELRFRFADAVSDADKAAWQVIGQRFAREIGEANWNSYFGDSIWGGMVDGEATIYVSAAIIKSRIEQFSSAFQNALQAEYHRPVIFNVEVKREKVIDKSRQIRSAV